MNVVHGECLCLKQGVMQVMDQEPQPCVHNRDLPDMPFLPTLLNSLT